jgi:hypothetical protein
LRPCFDFFEVTNASIYTGGDNAENGTNKGPTAKPDKKYLLIILLTSSFWLYCISLPKNGKCMFP